MKRKLMKALRNIKKEFFYIFSASKPKRILFDHLPKCGGTSITSYLASNYPNRKIYFTHKGGSHFDLVKKFIELSTEERYGYDLIIGHNSRMLFDFIHPESIKITLLRNPVDRIVSHFYYAKKRKNHYLYETIKERKLELDSYVTSNLSPELKNWYTSHFSGFPVEYIERNMQHAVDVAIESILTQYNIIGFIEKMNPFVEKVKEVAGLKKSFCEIMLNTTEGRPSINNINPVVLSKIELTNNADVEFYKRIIQIKGYSDLIVSI